MTQQTYEAIIERDKSYQVKAIVRIPWNYPEAPPLFTLSLLRDFVKLPPTSLPTEIHSKIDTNDLRAVNSLRSAAASAPTDPLQDNLENIYEDLHICYDEFCDQK